MTTLKMIALALITGLFAFAQQPTTETVTTTMEIIHGSQRETVVLVLPGPVPAVHQETAKPADPPPTSCACPVAKPVAPRKKVAVVPPFVPAKVQTAGIGAAPPLPEWILWLVACLFGVMLLAIAFILGRVTAPQPVLAGAPVVINIPPQQPPPAPAVPAVAPAVPAP